MRILADIPDKDLLQLNKLSEARRVPRAQLLRAAVASYLDSQSSGAMDSAFGSWGGRDNEDGLAYQKRMRDEW